MHGTGYSSRVESDSAKVEGEDSQDTYTTFSHMHRLGTPHIVNGAFELEEPRMCQIARPPIGSMVHSNLSWQCQSTPTRTKRN